MTPQKGRAYSDVGRAFGSIKRVITSVTSSSAERPRLPVCTFQRGWRDAADMAVIELVDRDPAAKGQDSGPRPDLMDDDDELDEEEDDDV